MPEPGRASWCSPIPPPASAPPDVWNAPHRQGQRATAWRPSPRPCSSAGSPPAFHAREPATVAAMQAMLERTPAARLRRLLRRRPRHGPARAPSRTSRRRRSSSPARTTRPRRRPTAAFSPTTFAGARYVELAAAHLSNIEAAPAVHRRARRLPARLTGDFHGRTRSLRRRHEGAPRGAGRCACRPLASRIATRSTRSSRTSSPATRGARSGPGRDCRGTPAAC